MKLPLSNKMLKRDADDSGVFYLSQFNLEDVIGAVLVDVVILNTGDYYELQLVFDGGKQIEIIRTDDNHIHIQTD